MPVTIGMCRETVTGEQRIAVVPDVARRYRALGTELCIEAGAGVGSHVTDEDFADTIVVPSAAEVYGKAHVICKVQAPSLEEIDAMAPGTVLVGFLQPYADPLRVQRLAGKDITSFAMELIPRISRAQSMDALSSQAAVAGYMGVLIAAERCPKFFPMMTYAAGTIRPAQVLVIGAGVAGLQAIATARRLGAVVSAYDVRPETREQIQTLGAKFVDTGVSAAGAGGYARELTDEEKIKQAETLARAIAQVDALITTAAVPGRRAPLIVTEEMVAGMKKGSVIVDLAAESGGNVAGVVAGETVQAGNAMLIGPAGITSRMSVHASEMYARNLFNFISPFIREGELSFDWEDEVLVGACLTRDGQVVHAGVRRALGL